MTGRTFVRRVAGAFVALVAPLGLTPVEPAAAVTAASGTASFTGSASLPTFPCPTPLTSGAGCNGSFTGHWTGHLNGAYDGRPFEVSWTTTPLTQVAAVSATFRYGELLCLAGIEDALGGASGTGSATAGPGQVVGFWAGGPAGSVPFPVIGVRLLFSFNWVRIGNAAVIQVTAGSALEIDIAGIGWVTVSTSEQNGAATFAPVGADGTVVPSCSTPLSGVTGVIVGSLALR